MTMVPMKRLTILCHLDELEDVLEKMQHMGVMHLESLGDNGSNLSSHVQERFDLVERIAKTLARRDPAPVRHQVDDLTLVEVVDILEDLLKQRHEAIMERDHLQEELEALRVWGQFEPDEVAFLEKHGVPVRFTAITRQEWHLFDKSDHAYALIREDEDFLHVVFFGDKHLPFTPLHLPEKSQKTLEQELAKSIEKIRDINLELGRYTHFEPLLRARMVGLQDRINLLHANRGVYQDGPVTALQGYVPEDVIHEVEAGLQEFTHVHILNDTKPGSRVPVLLRNRRFFKGFEAILKSFSGLHYGEKDVTWMVGILFILFGGLCLLDAGYGLLLLVTGIILRFTGKKDFGRVFALTGAFTIPLGLVSGQLFGLIVGRDIFPKMQPPVPLAVDPLACFIFSLIIGLLAMAFSYAIAIWQRGWRDHALGNFVLLMALGLAVVAYVQPSFSVALNAAALILSLFGLGAWCLWPQQIFEARAGNIAWTLYSGLTGIMQDILSHMRLFGIALSGSILALVVNKIGALFPVPITAAFAVVGHAFVYALALLSLYIHANRLIFLEVGGKCIEGGSHYFHPLKRGASS